MSVSGIIKNKLGFYGNFGLGIVSITICLGYTTFFLKVRRLKYNIESCHDLNQEADRRWGEEEVKNMDEERKKGKFSSSK